MTDLNLIEAAARAAGYEVRRYSVRELEVVHVKVGDAWALFDPIRFDGDAFRLAIACNLTISTGASRALATAFPGGGALTLLEEVGDDPVAATRRAITHAAEALYIYRNHGEC